MSFLSSRRTHAGGVTPPALAAGGASSTGAGAALPASPAADAGPWVCKERRAVAN